MKMIAAWIVDHPERMINLICVISMTVLYLMLLALSMHWLPALAFVSFMGTFAWFMLWLALESTQWKKLRVWLEQIGECKANECVPNVVIQLVVNKYKSLYTTVLYTLYLKGYGKNPYAKNKPKEDED